MSTLRKIASFKSVWITAALLTVVYLEPKYPNSTSQPPAMQKRAALNAANMPSFTPSELSDATFATTCGLHAVHADSSDLDKCQRIYNAWKAKGLPLTYFLNETAALEFQEEMNRIEHKGAWARPTPEQQGVSSRKPAGTVN